MSRWDLDLFVILKKIIVMIGYMGCGKTTLGKKLSKYYKLPFIDLDDEIVSFENNSIEKIKAKKKTITSSC